MGQRYEHVTVECCTPQDIRSKEINGWEICAAVGNPGHIHPTIYFKRPIDYAKTDLRQRAENQCKRSA